MAYLYHASDLPSHLLRTLLVSSSVLLSALLGMSHAQITLDGSLGPRRLLTGPNYAIPASVGQIRGANLFHSFDQFNVRTGESATFTGPATIANILSRVTGGSPSSIDGTIRSQIPGANLYLLNPSGVLFGSHATLDVSGSFHVSTADYLRLADGARFSARLSETSTLSVAPPVAFGFLGPPAAITVEGSTLEVLAGNAMSAVGGDIRIEGGILSAPSGQVHLVSVASMGEVRLDTTAQTPTPDVSSVDRLGTITIKGSLIDASGNGGGTVRIRGGRLLVDDALVFADTQQDTNGTAVGIDMNIRGEMVITNGSLMTSDTFGPGAAGSVTVQAHTITMTDGARMGSATFGPGQGGTVTVTADTLTLQGTRADGAFPSRLSATAEGQREGAGNAGAVAVQARAITLTDGAQISGSTFGPGQGGTVTVTATATLTLTNSGIFANTGRMNTAGTGTAGTVTIRARAITLADGANIASATFGPGRGGTVTVTADTLTLRGTAPGPARDTALRGTLPSAIAATAEGRGAGAGNAGAVVVQARAVTLTDGAQISGSTFGPGQGGTVTVTATDTLMLQGISADGTLASAIAATAEGRGAGAGNAGAVAVQARAITLTDGANISSVTFGPGQGGTVTVTADTLTLRGTAPGPARGTAPRGTLPSGIGASAQGRGVGAGNAGAVAVQARAITLTDGAQIGSATFGPGRGGTVTVTATDTLTLGAFASGIFATAEGTDVGAGAAGSIVVTAPRIMVTAGAGINSSTSGPGAGGSITVMATDTVDIAGQDSDLSASTAGQGPGGDVLLQARQVRLTDGATVSAESTGPGNAGNVTIAAADTFLSTNGSVVTRATQADGGNIQITASNFLRLRDSRITAEVGGGPQTVGGNIFIDPQFVILQNSQIVANAFAGQGGNIRITAGVFLADPASQVSASSELGINGQVNIQAPVTSLSGAVAPLPQAFAQAAELLRSRCVERLREGTVSRFVVGGRDGVPLEPGSLLQSPLQRVDQEAGVQEGKRQPQNPELQHAWVSSAQAHAREGWEGECARWMGQPGTPGSPKRRR